jgi:phosphopentomutase
VPVLVAGGDTSSIIGARRSYSDVGATIAQHLDLGSHLSGRPF